VFPFRWSLAFVDKLIVVLGEDVEHETARTLVGFIVVGAAALTLCDPPRPGWTNWISFLKSSRQ
jgi:hypothetical protein